MERRKKYSNGSTGSVFIASEQDQRNFPGAQIIRQEVAPYSIRPISDFYTLQIARALLPDNFLQLVGFQVEPTHQIVDGEPTFFFNSFSRLANVSPDHAVFSSHMNHDTKEVICTCNICITHKELHQGLLIRAQRIDHELDAFGLNVPYKDLSDYCATPDGNILFFETESIRPSILRRELRSLPASDQTTQAMELLRERQDIFDYYYSQINAGLTPIL